ncbi:hypothetical protein FEM33_25380 [Dyadobacter flavalbus]|uniref:T9SS type A sorting domain-containing protein n=1 Tax=Dyadobacter flavalbus TaxID=2579942 RepID=A0A5M8Q5J5_9BACT|nr:hypothetical protein [Dyadobacter flavalbus]KAA6430341.1 hypothetical protein FEM33_25380 [Dyadobacter flavalbus]
MKNSVKTFAFALALLASATFTASAEDKETKKASTFGTGIYPTKTGRINVLVDKVNNDANTVLLIKNENGDIIYRETINKNEQKFGRSLNLDEMEAGKYRLEVISGNEVQSKTFQLSAQKTERMLTVK